MKTFERQAIRRLPLAEAALLVLAWAMDAAHLSEVFDEHRGRCREQVIRFPLLVQLIGDALLLYEGSGRESFERGVESKQLLATIQAAYGKLRRLPIELSMAFLEEGTARLQQLFPDQELTVLPPSLSRFVVVTLDGKAIKRVARRLKATRGAKAGMLGGRALVAMLLKPGLAVLMHGHPDGEANDVGFLPRLLPVIRRRVSGNLLFLADRAFCAPKLSALLVGNGADHFVIRYSARAQYHPDRKRPTRTGQDQHGRRYVESWGWLGRPGHPQRCAVRHISLSLRGGKKLILVTNLLDARAIPAADLLELYRLRWTIEQMFQQVTEVFNLKALIGSSPQATVFQLAFCLLLYNAIQVVRGYVAEAQGRPCRTISTEKLFRDVQHQLTTWMDMIPSKPTVAHLRSFSNPRTIRSRLRRLLRSCWSNRWIKSPLSKHRPKVTLKRGSARTHGSVARVLLAYQQKTVKKKRCG